MFRKAAWFRPKRFGWGIFPISWQGWVYTMVWALALIIAALATTLAEMWFWGTFVFTAVLIFMIRDIKKILDEIAQSNTRQKGLKA